MEYYNKLEDPTDEENDMLDLAFGLTETWVFVTMNLKRILTQYSKLNGVLFLGLCRSRLGCQVIASPELDGMRLALPAATRNFAVDGFIPKPH